MIDRRMIAALKACEGIPTEILEKACFRSLIFRKKCAGINQTPSSTDEWIEARAMSVKEINEGSPYNYYVPISDANDAILMALNEGEINRATPFFAHFLNYAKTFQK